MSEDLRRLLSDDFLEWLMLELETCDDQIYNSNLSSSAYIEVRARKDALIEVRDHYCDLVRAPKLKAKKIINE